MFFLSFKDKGFVCGVFGFYFLFFKISVYDV